MPVHVGAHRCRHVPGTAWQHLAVYKVSTLQGEDGYWVAECPSLSRCVSQGQTKEEAIANAKEAIRAYIAALKTDGLPVPPARFDTMVVAV